MGDEGTMRRRSGQSGEGKRNFYRARIVLSPMKRIILFALSAVSLLAADATGKWTGTLTPASDNSGKPAMLVLKQDGAELTGTAGPDASEQNTILNGKADNGTLTFEIHSGGGTMKFTLKLDGDEIKGDIVRERDGQSQTATLAVKRDK